MLILTQDKRSIINLENVIMLQANKAETYPNRWRVAVYDTGDGVVAAGLYDTEKRALEIIEDIFSTYASYRGTDGGPLYTKPGGYVQPFAFIPPKVYRMPEV